MNDKQRRFVAEYLVDLNGTQAAIRAGYSARTAESQASTLLRNPKVRTAVSEGKAKQLAKADVTAQRVLNEIARLSFSDARKLFDESGNLKPLHELTDDEAAAIASVEIVVQPKRGAEDRDPDTIHKIKVWDKTRSLEMLAKHFGLLTDKVEHSGQITLPVKVVHEYHTDNAK